MEPRKFEWHCPHPGCKYDLTAYTEGGLATMRGFHEERHARERLAALGPEPPKPLKYLDVLELTVADKAFLKTRGVKYD